MKTKIKQTLATIIALTLTLCTLSACGTNPKKSILGKWYNANGDCLKIQSDNTYRTDFVEEMGKTIGSGSGKWVYLEEENLFKFYSNDDRVWEINISKDKHGESFEYSYYGVFYKNEFPVEVIEEMKREKEEQYLESTVVCPNFVGKSYEEIITNKEYKDILNFMAEWQHSDDYDQGTVFEQSEEANERIFKNTTITLYISMGRTIVNMPDVYGMQEVVAINVLKKQGFSNIVIDEIYSEEVEKGLVVKSQPERAASVSKETEIILYISSEK